MHNICDKLYTFLMCIPNNTQQTVVYLYTFRHDI